MSMKLKAALFVIILVVCSIVAYRCSGTGGAEKIADGVGDVVSTVGSSVSEFGENSGLVTPESKVSTKDVRQPCTSNKECKNGACGRLTAGEGALICCPSGAVTLYAGYDYCTQMADNSACWSDVMCASGYCKDNNGGLEKGVCKPRANVGGACESDEDCKNSACARATAADNAGLTCCASGGTQMYAGYSYCSEMADGGACWSDAMCASGYCKGNSGGLTKGVCITRKAAGAACTANGDCANNACARATAAEGTGLSCCASGATTLYAGYDYCTKMPKGSTCRSDAMCNSGNCSGNLSGLQRGTCD